MAFLGGFLACDVSEVVFLNMVLSSKGMNSKVMGTSQKLRKTKQILAQSAQRFSGSVKNSKNLGDFLQV